MAVLSDADRAAANRLFTDELSAAREPISVVKADLRAAVNAIDQWVDDNATSFNQAIPQPARAQLTAKQKARILLHVVRKRFEVA